MATNMKKSLMTYPFVLIFFLGALLIGSCKDSQPKNQVCITVEKNTSDSAGHFMPVMEIDNYKNDFKKERDSLGIKCPGIFIPNYETFSEKSITDILSDTAVVGLRFYYGVRPSKSKKKALRLMIVGVNAAGKDVYIKNPGAGLAAQAGSDEGGMEYGQCTPPCTIEEP